MQGVRRDAERKEQEKKNSENSKLQREATKTDKRNYLYRMANFNWTFVDVDGVLAVTSISASSFISASTFHGDGSGLTGISAAGGFPFTGSAGISGSLSIENTSTDDSILITTTEDTNTAAPVLAFKRNSSSPSNGDYLGQLKFKGENDADQEVVYAKITAKISDVTDTTEDGLIEYAVRKAGSNAIVARLTSANLKLINGTGIEVNGSIQTDSDVSATGQISGSLYYGNGSNLTGLSSYNSFTANFNVSASYDIIGINTSGSVVTASLGAANTYAAGQRLVFKDIGGSGSTNNVVIEPSGSQTIDSGTSLKIQVNYGAVTIVSDGASTFHIIGAN